MSYKFLAVAVTLLAEIAAANAHTVQNLGTPTDYNQGVERDVHGSPHGSLSNPSPHSLIPNQVEEAEDGSFASIKERRSDDFRASNFAGSGTGYSVLLNAY